MSQCEELWAVYGGEDEFLRDYIVEPVSRRGDATIYMVRMQHNGAVYRRDVVINGNADSYEIERQILKAASILKQQALSSPRPVGPPPSTHSRTELSVGDSS